MNGLPEWFKFNPAEFFARPDVYGLSARDCQALLWLVFRSWNSDPPCTHPNDDARLARMVGMTGPEWAEARPSILSGWKVRADGLIEYPWLAEQYSRAAGFIARQSEAGKASGRARSSTTAEPPLNAGSTTVEEKRTGVEPTDQTRPTPPDQTGQDTKHQTKTKSGSGDLSAMASGLVVKNGTHPPPDARRRILIRACVNEPWLSRIIRCPHLSDLTLRSLDDQAAAAVGEGRLKPERRGRWFVGAVKGELERAGGAALAWLDACEEESEARRARSGR